MTDQDVSASEAKLALRESEQLFESTFEEAPLGFAIVAPDGRWLRANRRLSNLLGYTHEDFLATNFESLTHPDDDDVRQGVEATQQLLEGKIDRFTQRKRYRRQDGQFMWANLTLNLHRDGDGRPQYFVAMIEDITERKQADEARQFSEEREAERLRVFQSTMRTVQNIVNNFLANMQVFRLEAEGKLSEESLTLFDRLIQDTAKELSVLSNIETIHETKMAIGTGIDYGQSTPEE